MLERMGVASMYGGMGIKFSVVTENRHGNIIWEGPKIITVYSVSIAGEKRDLASSSPSHMGDSGMAFEMDSVVNTNAHWSEMTRSSNLHLSYS